MIKTCPYCNSHNIAIGYHLGGGRLYSDQYAYHSNSSASDLETYFCKDCGMVIAQKVLRPEIFDNLDDIREDELLEKINDLGIMLINHHDYLPSLSDDGFTMQNIIGLIEKHRIFYTKAFAKRPVLLSIKTYQLLKRVKKTLLDENYDPYFLFRSYFFCDCCWVFGFICFNVSAGSCFIRFLMIRVLARRTFPAA